MTEIQNQTPRMSRELLGNIVDEVFDGAIEDASVIEAIYAAIKRHETPPPSQHMAVDPALLGIAEEMKESGGCWRPCSGCYDTEDGHPTQKYAFSPALQTDIGCGCHECGGLGAVWWHMTDEELAEFEKACSDIDVEDRREQKLATVVAPDNGAPHEVLLAVLECAKAWVPEARIVGNVRAGDIARAIEAIIVPPNDNATAILTELSDTYVSQLEEHDRAMQFGGYVPLDDDYPIEVPLRLCRLAYEAPAEGAKL